MGAAGRWHLYVMAGSDLHTGTWVTYVGGRAAGVRVRRCRLEVTSGPDAGLVRDIDAGEIRIGARRDNEVQLSDAKVSGAHCEIRLDERGYRLCDLGSTNGTYVSGMRVMDVYISPGTTITVGESKLRFEPLDESLEMPLATSERFGTMVGKSVKMRELFARLDKLAKSNAAVLITGETGVGKELVAESLHQYSDRARGPFVVLDCGSIPPNLIESQIFGHERGAFTGAISAHAGVFERAHHGTVFLDEVGELPLAMQPKLLRVLERHEVQRVGGQKIIPVDIRVVAATHRDLGVEINHGRFREDLYYRLAVARVQVPPLRARLEDIPLLIDYILAQTAGGENEPIAPETVALMMRHDWPGNVRQLRNVIERAVALSEAPENEAALRDDAPRPPIGPPAEPNRGPALEPGVASGDERLLRAQIDIARQFKDAKHDLVSEFERRYVTQLLRAHEGNVTQAARAAGLDRNSLHKIMRRLELDNPVR